MPLRRHRQLALQVSTVGYWFKPNGISQEIKAAAHEDRVVGGRSFQQMVRIGIYIDSDISIIRKAI